MAESPDLDAWVAARGPALLRLAYTLTGNRTDAYADGWSSTPTPRPGAGSGSGSGSSPRVSNAGRHARRRGVRSRTGTRGGRATADLARLPALPEGQRTAVVLRCYEQLDYAEIAALTGVREGSVHSRVSRGLAGLRQALGEDPEDSDG